MRGHTINSYLRTWVRNLQQSVKSITPNDIVYGMVHNDREFMEADSPAFKGAIIFGLLCAQLLPVGLSKN